MAELLALDGVRAGYGESVVLDDIALRLDEGDSLALLGRNGVGKTTLLVTLMGFTECIAAASAGVETISARCRPIAAPAPGWAGCRRSA